MADLLARIPSDFADAIVPLFGFMTVGVILVGFGWLPSVVIRFGRSILGGR